MEVVFNENARASLCQSSSFGVGPYPDEGPVPFADAACSGGDAERAAQARRCAQRQAELEWEQAAAITGPLEIYCFQLGLSVGDISEAVPGPRRRSALHICFDIFSEMSGARWSDSIMERAGNDLEQMLRRAGQGEPVRVWCSDQADDLCGLYWLLSQLEPLKTSCGAVSRVMLPRWEVRPDGCVETHAGWHEVSPGAWGRYLPLEEPLPAAARRAFAHRWRILQRENAPLRSQVNGQLISVPEDFYDGLIAQEIARQPVCFQEAHVIGVLLGRCPGVSAGWLARRIEVKVRQNELETVSENRREDPVYHRILRKK